MNDSWAPYVLIATYVSALPETVRRLIDLRFAAKDLYEVEGFVCCAGDPNWLRTHLRLCSTAPVIARLPAAGATLMGKTVMDEMEFSLGGENLHYGSPFSSSRPHARGLSERLGERGSWRIG